MKASSAYFWTIALGAAVGTILANVALTAASSAVTSIKGSSL